MDIDEFHTDIRVYIEDTDAGGIVYYVNYLKFMERARAELLRHLGFGKGAVLGDGKLLVVHSLNVSYKRAARLDDLLTVTAKVIKLTRAAIIFEQKIYNADELLCEGTVKIACVRPVLVEGDENEARERRETMRPSALPDEMHHAILAIIGDNSAQI